MPVFSSRSRILFLSPFIFLLLACLPSAGRAQGSEQILLRIADSMPEVMNEALEDVTIEIDNTAGSDFTGILHLYCGKGARVATKQDIPVSVAAGKRLFVPAKVYIGATTPAGNIPYSAVLSDGRRTRIATAAAQLHLAGSRVMRASLTQPDIIMSATGSTLRIPVLVSNRGNISQTVDIVLAYPPELQDRVNKSIRLEVPPFRDTLLYFERRVSRAMVKMSAVNISLYGVYNGGDYFSIASATVQSIKSRKKFSNTRSVNNFGTNLNSISLGIQNAFSSNESYSLQSKGDYALNRQLSLAYSVNLFRWKSSGMPTLVNDTWLELRYKGAGIRGGNIVQNGEMSYSGRGVEAYVYLDSQQHYKVYTGYIDKSFNLLNTAGGSASFGRAAWAGFLQQTTRFRNNTMLSYDEDKYTRTRNMILVNEGLWRISDFLLAGFKTGFANSNPDSDTLQSRQSYSLNASISGSLTKALSMSSDNLYASGYYPGSRRGTFSLNERLSLRMGQFTLSGGYMYTNLQPQYLRSGNLAIRNNNRSSTAEMALSAAMGSVTLFMAPQYYREEGNWYDATNTLNSTLDAVRLSASISYAGIAIRQNLMLRTDIGRYRTGFQPEQRWQFRANLTYNLGFFRLSANVQKGNFYLSEAFQEHAGSTRRSDLRINIAPTVTASFFNNRLKADAGVTYYKDYFISSILYNGALNLYLNTTRIFATVQYNTFSQASSYRNVQLGITQLLPQSGKDNISNKGSLHIQVYYDVNGNSQYDTGDSLAAGYIASVNKTLLMADNNGQMVYSKLPAGNYKIYFPIQKGWYGRDQSVVLLEKQSATVTVPLRQTGTLTGSIRYEYNELLSYSTEKDVFGQTIRATDADGKIFEGKTDDNGAYQLYLPTGSYMVTVDGLPEQIEVTATGQQQPVSVLSGQITGNVDFILKVKQRKVEVKKFGQ